VDWVRLLGIDGFRVDTARHVEAAIWKELKKLASEALKEWKKENPYMKLDDLDFYMTAEVYGYDVIGGREFDMGNGELIDFFDNGFPNLINFSFKSNATLPPHELFQLYADVLQSDDMQGLSVFNYLSSHDDPDPFDSLRMKTLESGSKLLLSPGGVQIYYGDETGRTLQVEGTQGDATLRSNMNWEDIEKNTEIHGVPVQTIFGHWSKLGIFRKEHIAVGAGQHTQLQEKPFIFKREYNTGALSDKVLVALDLPEGKVQSINVFDVFQDGTLLKDYYSGSTQKVKNGAIKIKTSDNILLLAEAQKN
jgi:alpha-amylase